VRQFQISISACILEIRELFVDVRFIFYHKVTR
jgi:hypothetical protein